MNDKKLDELAEKAGFIINMFGQVIFPPLTEDTRQPLRLFAELVLAEAKRCSSCDKEHCHCEMTNPEFHICSSCTYAWRHGQDGSHSCAENLRSHIDQIAIQLGLTTSHMSVHERIRTIKLRIDGLVRLESELNEDDEPWFSDTLGPNP